MRIALAFLSLVLMGAAAGQSFRILVFSKTAGFRHGSISDGIALITNLAPAHDFAADFSENAADFNDANLARYAAVVFLSTTGDVLDAGQQAAFERFIQAGGGWAGVHSAADTEYDWPWYNGLLGAHFQSHPAQQTATIRVEDPNHPSTSHLTDPWIRRDEWYNYRTNPRPDVTVLLTLDESTYSGGSMGADHPIAWYHAYDGGRAWYTGLGHTSASFAEQDFIDHLLGGILYAAGVGVREPTRRTESLLAAGATWKFWDRGEDLGTAWRTPQFDDSAWPSGPAKLGFGDGDHVTPIDLGPDDNRHRTTYFRTRFQLAELPLSTRLTVRILRDDGAVIHLNGTEIGRSNMDPGAVSYSTFASNAVPNDEENLFFRVDVSAHIDKFVAGENVLAVEIHQASSGSSDLGFDMDLLLETIIPPVVEVAPAPGGGIAISWREEYSTTYGGVLQHATNLADWNPFPKAPVIADGIATCTLNAEEIEERGFFRLQYGLPVP